MFSTFYLAHADEKWTCASCALPSLSNSFFESDGFIVSNDKPTSINQSANASNFIYLAENYIHNNEELLIHLNCRSLLPTIDELCAVFELSKPLFIAAAETWLNNSITDMEVNMNSLMSTVVMDSLMAVVWLSTLKVG